MKTPDFTRRDFVKGLSAATLGALGAGLPRPSMAAEGEALRPPATADTIIVLWMGGGMASTETFDPKRYTPYEKGMNPNTVLSTFPSIPTAVDGIRLSEGLEKVAKVMDRGTLIRTYTAGDLGFILHSRHQFHWHTGYAPPQSVACPHIGAMMSRTLGPKKNMRRTEFSKSLLLMRWPVSSRATSPLPCARPAPTAHQTPTGFWPSRRWRRPTLSAARNGRCFRCGRRS